MVPSAQVVKGPHDRVGPRDFFRGHEEHFQRRREAAQVVHDPPRLVVGLRRGQEAAGHAGLPEVVDLVLDQGHERGDDDGDPRAQERGQLVAQRLAPARRHQHEDVPARQGGVDRHELVVAELGVAEVVEVGAPGGGGPGEVLSGPHGVDGAVGGDAVLGAGAVVVGGGICGERRSQRRSQGRVRDALARLRVDQRGRKVASSCSSSDEGRGALGKGRGGGRERSSGGEVVVSVVSAGVRARTNASAATVVKVCRKRREALILLLLELLRDCSSSSRGGRRRRRRDGEAARAAADSAALGHGLGCLQPQTLLF